MNVGFNASLLTDDNTRGFNRYTINLILHLAREKVQPFLYSNGPIHPSHLRRFAEIPNLVIRSEYHRFPFWANSWLPHQLKKDKIDLFHSTFNCGLPIFSAIPDVLTVHDAIIQRGTLRLNKDLLNVLDRWASRHVARRIITVSSYSKQDIMETFRIKSSKIEVIYEAADPIFHHEQAPDFQNGILQKLQIGKYQYFFYVGGWEGRKNIAFLLKAFASSNSVCKLLLAGGKADEMEEMSRLVSDLRISDKVILLGRLPDDHLPTLYRHALAFVYPSKWEGFGLQLCEAMAVGCPILASNATCLPEILGDGGEIFDPDNLDQLRALLNSMDEGARVRLSELSRRRSQSFSWEKTAKQTIDSYRTVLS